MFKNKSGIVLLAVVGTLVVLLGTASAAEAQGIKPPMMDRHPIPRGGFLAGEGGPGNCGGMMMAGGMGGFSLVDATAQVTGLTTDEVIAALQDGQTFADIAEAQGVEPQAIADAFLAGRRTLLEQAVADGRITQEQMDLMLEHMEEEATEHLEGTWTPRSFQGGRGRMGGFGGRMGGFGGRMGGFGGWMAGSGECGHVCLGGDN